MVNGGPGLRLLLGDELDTVATMRVDDGVVTELYLVRNPHKLGRVDDRGSLCPGSRRRLAAQDRGAPRTRGRWR